MPARGAVGGLLRASPIILTSRADKTLARVGPSAIVLLLARRNKSTMP